MKTVKIKPLETNSKLIVLGFYEDKKELSEIQMELDKKFLGVISSNILKNFSGKFNEIFQRLQKSPFRAKFKLSVADKKYIADKGIDTIRSHCQDFVKKRLSPAVIPNDGKQTPMRGHPVFVAQHATACCCRGCISKWHQIPSGRELSEAEQEYLVDLLMSWISHQVD